MIDIVIPLTSQEKGDKNIELRYTLRGMEKHLRYVHKVFIVGACPGWIRNVAHLPFQEYEFGAKYREKNIFTKLLHSMRYVTGDNFLFMNDDHFLLEDFCADEFPMYYSGTLKSKAAQLNDDDAYGKVLRNTIELLGEHKLFYDIHCPMIFKTECLLRIENFWAKEYGYCLKTFHHYWDDEDLGNGILQADMKFRKPQSSTAIEKQIAGYPFFSTTDSAVNNDMLSVLNWLYPNKSIYEA